MEFHVRFSVQREAPRHKAVASRRLVFQSRVATSVRLHGTRPWHLNRESTRAGDSSRRDHLEKTLPIAVAAYFFWFFLRRIESHSILDGLLDDPARDGFSNSFTGKL